jgi:hypothetical protein
MLASKEEDSAVEADLVVRGPVEEEEEDSAGQEVSGGGVLISIARTARFIMASAIRP